jgi:predicted Holliday junction resolvase-like endonuclease
MNEKTHPELDATLSMLEQMVCTLTAQVLELKAEVRTMQENIALEAAKKQEARQEAEQERQRQWAEAKCQQQMAEQLYRQQEQHRKDVMQILSDSTANVRGISPEWAVVDDLDVTT